MNRQSLKSGFPALRARLDESLFPTAPQPQRPSDWRRHGLLAAVFVLLVLLQFFRPGWSVVFNSLWAEDGSVMLQGGLTHAFGGAVFVPYAGYLVVVPHLIGEVASLFPLRDAPAAITIQAAALVACSGLAVWYGAAGHIRNQYLRGGLSVFAVLAPMSGLESVDSASYASWFMLFGAFWLLLWRPRGWTGTILASLFVLGTALSNPAIWFFIPLAALRAVAIRDRRDATIVAAFAAGAITQMPVLALSNEHILHAAWSRDIIVAYPQRVIAGGALGIELAGDFWQRWSWGFLLPVVAAATAILVLGLRYSTRNARWLALIAVPTSVVMFVVSAYQRGAGPALVWPLHTFTSASSRYVLPPALLLVGVAVAFVDGLMRRHPRRRWPRALAVAMFAVMTAGIVTSFDMEDFHARGDPPWRMSLREAARVCQSEGLSEMPIHVSPVDAAFIVVVPCDRLSAYAPNQARVPLGSPGAGSR